MKDEHSSRRIEAQSITSRNPSDGYPPPLRCCKHFEIQRRCRGHTRLDNLLYIEMVQQVLHSTDVITMPMGNDYCIEPSNSFAFEERSHDAFAGIIGKASGSPINEDALVVWEFQQEGISLTDIDRRKRQRWLAISEQVCKHKYIESDEQGDDELNHTPPISKTEYSPNGKVVENWNAS